MNYIHKKSQKIAKSIDKNYERIYIMKVKRLTWLVNGGYD